MELLGHQQAEFDEAISARAWETLSSRASRRRYEVPSCGWRAFGGRHGKEAGFCLEDESSMNLRHFSTARRILKTGRFKIRTLMLAIPFAAIAFKCVANASRRNDHKKIICVQYVYPFEGKIISIGMNSLTIDVGSDDGILSGNIMYVYNPGNLSQLVASLRITGVERHSSSAIIVNDGIELVNIHIGYKVTSHIIKR